MTKKSLLNAFAASAASLLLGACASPAVDSEKYSAEFNTYLDKKFDKNIERSPESMTYLGIKKDYDKLDDLSEKRRLEDFELAKADLKELRTWRSGQLSPRARLSYELAQKKLTDRIENFKYRHYGYPVSPSFGFHTDLPSFLINFHKISDLKDAEAYIARVHEIPRVTDEVIALLEVQKNKGIILPQFLMDSVLEEIQNTLQGSPLKKGARPHIIKQDFSSKLKSLKISGSEKQRLQKELDLALTNSFRPAFEKLHKQMENLKSQADHRAGAWKFPDGDRYYNHLLRRYTTTDLNAEAIHQIGLRETERIHQEMKQIIQRIGFQGDLKAFFKELQSNKKFYFTNSTQGRKQYVARTEKIISDMKQRLPELFSRFPKADLTVKPVEKFREKSAAMAFYTGPSPDGSRPGIYYINLYDLTHVPNYEMEALAYHEAIPGHHMQISIAQELPDLPKFRRFGGYTAYVEGWGLYAESLPKKIGLYRDPYSDFGRLSMELMRSGRLVVDTGLHQKKWTREQAVQWLDENTPDTHTDNLKAIDRYIVMPGQATAYMIGKLKFVELRERAEKALGDKFDIRKFHDIALHEGALPLDQLELLVEKWILEQKKL